MLVSLALLLAACGGGDGEGDGGGKPVAGCAQVEKPGIKRVELEAPKEELDPGKRWIVTFATSCGDFDVELGVKAAPKTAASLAYLVREHVYDGTVVHRVATNFVIQGGDPEGRGSGGPGYSIVETPAPTTTYGRGTVAMAKTTEEPQGASGSQFFVVTGSATSFTSPDYAVVGRVVSGMEIVDRIGSIKPKPAPDGVPTQTVLVRTAKLSSRP